MLKINNLYGFGSGSRRFAAEFTDFDGSTGAGSSGVYTFSDKSLGAAPLPLNKRRIVIAATGADNALAFDITSITVQGLTCDIHVNGTDTLSSSRTRAIIGSVEVPFGVTGDVVITWNQTSPSGCGIEVYALYNLNSDTPADSINPSGNSPSDTIDVPAGGLLVACSQNLNSGMGAWSAGNPGNEVNVFDISSSDYHAGGYEVYETAQSGITVSRSSGDTCIAAASWR